MSLRATCGLLLERNFYNNAYSINIAAPKISQKKKKILTQYFMEQVISSVPPLVNQSS